jgi:predicted acetyltransferase
VTATATDVEVIPATPEQQPILANLIELYAHDFSEFREMELGEDGRFGYLGLPLYWRDPERHPFIVRVKGNLAGFVLVKQVSGVWDMAEFFVVRRYRGRGMGMQIAQTVLRRFPGRWEVRVMEANHSAHLFWERAISAFVGETIPAARVEKDGRWWRVFSFNSV